MGKKPPFIQKMLSGEICLGTVITFTDPTVTEALSANLDFVWIDMEHNPLSLEAVQGHIMATKGSLATPLVRVPWNDPVLIKPVLDIGAAGIIVPMVRSAEQARRAVEACLYPPLGIRGFGPRRPSNYGRMGGPEFCNSTNESMIVIPQLEHIDAARDIDAIVSVPGVSAVTVGPNDLSGTMGLMGQARHPEVIAAIEAIIQGARRANVPVGVGIGCDFQDARMWLEKGAQWLALASDVVLMTQATDQLVGRMRSQIPRA